MIVTTFRVDYKMTDVIKLKPIFDVHLGHGACDVRAFKDYLADGFDDRTYFIGGGDLLDSIVLRDFRYRKGVDVTLGEEIVDEQVDICYQLLQPYKERIIGLGDGNHEKQVTLRCGTNPTKRLCRRLGCQYLGYSWLVKLMLRGVNGGTRKLVIYGHHGWGGGSRTQGADITKFSKIVKHWQADIFLFGHVHKLQSDKINRIGLFGEKMISKPKLLCICGTFMKTYLKSNVSTWSEEKGYPPVEVGGLVVHIRPTSHKWIKYWSSV